MQVRRVIFLWATLALSLVLIVAAAGPGAALGQATITVKEGPPVEKSYGPVNPSDPNPVFATPDQCRNAPSCDTIPLVIEPPGGLDSSQDFYVRISLFWDDRKVNGQQGSDLDLRLYFKTTNIARAKTPDMPEEILIYRPIDKDYALTVINFAGPNTGYRIKAEMLTEGVSPPAEFQESGPPPDLSDVPEERSGSSTVAAPISGPPADPAAFGPQPISQDEAFFNLAQQSGQLSRFLGASDQLQDLGQQESAPPGPVPASQVILWAGVFPLTLAGAGALWLRLRSPARLEAAA